MHKNENKELKSKLASLQERLSEKEVSRNPSLLYFKVIVGMFVCV